MLCEYYSIDELYSLAKVIRPKRSGKLWFKQLEVSTDGLERCSGWHGQQICFAGLVLQKASAIVRRQAI